MYIKEVIATENEVFEMPDWVLIASLINKLDGHYLSNLLIGDVGEEHFIAIYGGNDERYHIVAQLGEPCYYTLVKPGKGKRDIMIVTGGAECYRPREECQTLKTALQAAKTFVESGQLDPRFTWRVTETRGPGTDLG